MKSNSTSPERQSKIPVYGLDLVRFVAAMLVVIYHLAFKPFAIEGSTLNKVLGVVVFEPPGSWFAWTGWLGVQVFFVVSGAVICYSVQSIDAFSFAVRRLTRLVPALLIAVCIAVPVAVIFFDAAIGMSLVLALKTIFFVPIGPWLLGQFWTIPIELSFYGLIWLLLCARHLEKGLVVLPWILGVGSAVFWVVQNLDVLFWGGRVPELLLLSHGAYFSLGMLCARLSSGRIGKSTFVLAGVCLVAVFFQFEAAAGTEMANLPHLASNWQYAFWVWFVITVIIALSFACRNTIAVKVEGWGGILRILGLATYPLYLTHIHVGGPVLLYMQKYGILWAQFSSIFVSLVVSIVIALWIEPPLYKIVSQFFVNIQHRVRAPSRLV